jgi:hypothetical protein
MKSSIPKEYSSISDFDFYFSAKKRFMRFMRFMSLQKELKDDEDA